MTFYGIKKRFLAMVDLLSRFEFMVFPAKSDFVCVCVIVACSFWMAHTAKYFHHRFLWELISFPVTIFRFGHNISYAQSVYCFQSNYRMFMIIHLVAVFFSLVRRIGFDRWFSGNWCVYSILWLYVSFFSMCASVRLWMSQKFAFFMQIHFVTIQKSDLNL